MGYLSLLFTLIIIAVGTWYYTAGHSLSTVTFTNDARPPMVQELDQYHALTDQAKDIKQSLEEGAKKTMSESDETSPSPETPKPQETIASPKIIEHLMTTGFAVPDKPRAIDTIVIHSSYDPNGRDPYSVDSLVKIYESYHVSAHYLIDRAGTIYRLVPDADIAYHAGVSKMPDGRQEVNNFSLGIEMMNQETTRFTKAQYDALRSLIAFLKQRYPIKYVVGHSDIAPKRKTDPWNFDWKQLEIQY